MQNNTVFHPLPISLPGAGRGETVGTRLTSLLHVQRPLFRLEIVLNDTLRAEPLSIFLEKSIFLGGSKVALLAG